MLHKLPFQILKPQGQLLIFHISLLASFIRQLVALLPIAWILMRLFGVELVWMAFPLAEIVGFVYSAFSLRYVYRKDIKNMTPEI